MAHSKVNLKITYPAGTNAQGQPLPAVTPTLNKGGRPRSFNTEQELRDGIEQYFFECEQNKLHPNKAGLAVYFGVTKENINEYARGTYDSTTDKFSVAIKEAHARMEDHWVNVLAKPAPTGAIFYMKNAFGYRDVVENPGGGTTINFVLPPEIAGKYNLPTGQPPIDGNKDVSIPNGDKTQENMGGKAGANAEVLSGSVETKNESGEHLPSRNAEDSAQTPE